MVFWSIHNFLINSHDHTNVFFFDRNAHTAFLKHKEEEKGGFFHLCTATQLCEEHCRSSSSSTRLHLPGEAKQEESANELQSPGLQLLGGQNASFCSAAVITLHQYEEPSNALRHQSTRNAHPVWRATRKQKFDTHSGRLIAAYVMLIQWLVHRRDPNLHQRGIIISAATKLHRWVSLQIDAWSCSGSSFHAWKLQHFVVYGHTNVEHVTSLLSAPVWPVNLPTHQHTTSPWPGPLHLTRRAQGPRVPVISGCVELRTKSSNSQNSIDILQGLLLIFQKLYNLSD